MLLPDFLALLHQTTLHPTKLELLASWLPAQPWFHGDAAALRQVGAFRFDDPNGEVGIETILVTAGDDAVYQVPLTYRGTSSRAARTRRSAQHLARRCRPSARIAAKRTRRSEPHRRAQCSCSEHLLP